MHVAMVSFCSIASGTHTGLSSNFVTNVTSIGSKLSVVNLSPWLYPELEFVNISDFYQTWPDKLVYRSFRLFRNRAILRANT